MRVMLLPLKIYPLIAYFKCLANIPHYLTHNGSNLFINESPVFPASVLLKLWEGDVWLCFFNFFSAFLKVFCPCWVYFIDV